MHVLCLPNKKKRKEKKTQFMHHAAMHLFQGEESTDAGSSIPACPEYECQFLGQSCSPNYQRQKINRNILLTSMHCLFRK